MNVEKLKQPTIWNEEACNKVQKERCSLQALRYDIPSLLDHSLHHFTLCQANHTIAYSASLE